MGTLVNSFKVVSWVDTELWLKFRDIFSKSINTFFNIDLSFSTSIKSTYEAFISVMGSLKMNPSDSCLQVSTLTCNPLPCRWTESTDSLQINTMAEVTGCHFKDQIIKILWFSSQAFCVVCSGGLQLPHHHVWCKVTM